MKGVKFWLFAIATVAVLAMVGCVSVPVPKTSIGAFIVEALAYDRQDQNGFIDDVAEYFETNNMIVIVLFYDLDTFKSNDRFDYFSGGGEPPKESVAFFAQNQYCGTKQKVEIELDPIVKDIQDKYASYQDVNILDLELVPQLTGSIWEIRISDNQQSTAGTYVILEFKKIEDSYAYEVTEISVSDNIDNLNISSVDSKLGYAFFKIVNGVIVDAAVKIPD